MDIKKINTIRTRKIRQGEKNGRTGYFLTKEELDELDKNGKIAYRFNVFGGEYAYLKEEVFSDDDYIVEIHYTTIDDWKKIKPDIKAIYILPNDINVSIQKTKERNLSTEKENERITELQEQYSRFLNEEELRNKFDFCIHNNYDEESKEQIINLIKKLKRENTMNTYFSLDDNFDEIIENELKQNFDIKTINSKEQISTGWTNIVYKVNTDNGNYYFRFPRDDFWEKTIVKDYQFAKYIKGKTSFNTVDLKLGYSNNRPFSIHKEIEGVALAERMNDLSQEDIEKISSQLAKFMHELHNLPYDENEIFTVNNIGLELQDFITELLEKHVSKEDNKFWFNNNFKTHPKEQCLVHGDFNSSNVLLDENNNVTAIIDFGFGGFGSQSQDISRIIGRCPEDFKKPIIKAYENYAKEEIEKSQLNQDIETWNNIDNAYINYMTKIGIYKK